LSPLADKIQYSEGIMNVKLCLLDSVREKIRLKHHSKRSKRRAQ